MRLLKYLLYPLLFLLSSCSEEYLDKKPNKSIVVPTTLADLQALLDNTSVMNKTPGIGLLGADDFFTTDEGWQQFPTPIEKNSYIWASDIYQGQLSCSDWNNPYQAIFYSNVVLDGLSRIDITPSNEAQWKSIKGRALFYRAFHFYQLAQLFCKPYSAAVLKDAGIVIKTSPDVNSATTRSSIEETYNRIESDLLESSDLLDMSINAKTQPSKAAAKALLARLYLTLSDFSKAEQAASEALTLTGELTNYNALSVDASRPITFLNNEVLFHTTMITYSFTGTVASYVDSLLYKTYDVNDLRRKVFFEYQAPGQYAFKGTYAGTLGLFAGLSNNEVYLTRSEARVRLGKVSEALEDLNALLLMRFSQGTFTPVSENNPQQLLQIVLAERQKELVFRDIRWSDLRRLNQEPEHQKTLQRRLNGTDYALPPNDKRYVYPIPPQEISESYLQQNDRGV